MLIRPCVHTTPPPQFQTNVNKHDGDQILDEMSLPKPKISSVENVNYGENILFSTSTDHDR